MARVLQRIIVPLLLAPLVAVSGCDDGAATESLITVTDVKQANLIMVRLEDSGVPDAVLEEDAGTRSTSYSVRVPANRLADARRVLVKYDLPRSTEGGFDQMLSGSRLIPTESEERARLMHATASELARTFEMWDRIVDARVHLMLPEQDELAAGDSQNDAVSALVVLRYIPTAEEENSTNNTTSEHRTPIEDEDVKDMVAAAITPLWQPVDDSRESEGSPPGGNANGSGPIVVQWARVESVGAGDSQLGEAQRTIAQLQQQLAELRDAEGKDPSAASLLDDRGGSTTRLLLLGTTSAFAILTVVFGYLFVNERRKSSARKADEL